MWSHVQIGEVNEMFQDLAVLINDQGVQVGCGSSVAEQLPLCATVCHSYTKASPRRQIHCAACYKQGVLPAVVAGEELLPTALLCCRVIATA